MVHKLINWQIKTCYKITECELYCFKFSRLENCNILLKKTISHERKLIFVHGNINGIKAISKRLLTKKNSVQKWQIKIFFVFEKWIIDLLELIKVSLKEIKRA